MAGKYWRTLPSGKRVRTQAGVKHEYDKFQSSPKQIAERDARNSARRSAINAGKAHKGDGMDVHHLDSNPLHNSASNLRVEPASKNRGHRENSRKRGSKRRKSTWGKN